MDPEAAITLFDSCWFHLEILKKRPNPSSSSTSETDPDRKIKEISPEWKEFQTQLVVETRSKAELLSSNSGYNSDSFSPVSVLPESHFRSTPETEKKVKRGNRGKRRGRKGEKGSLSKSLSELEFQELKGFMDLGFEFSEEDVNSSLVEIIPGLQKLGKKEEEEEKKTPNKPARARPYLSEAWEAMEKEERKKNQLMNWRIPAMNNEVNMKDSLKWWAHTVASTVR
nr:uncharacterized protein LOC109164799 [Ipomoea trifida]